ncbi:MAG TPA: hypothetical protein DCS93_13755 [Microscillaceae bacterium]|nr:hypothetical protein [Microscillaceae bacterium]
MQAESFISIKPSSKKLRQYIAYYYFHSAADPSLKKHFLYYPNHKNAVTVYKNSSIIYQPGYSASVPCNHTPISILYSGIQSQYRIAEIQAPFDKIGIVFQSLGINHFLKGNLDEVLPRTDDKSFDHFGKSFKEACLMAYNEPLPDKRVNILDDFFQVNYQTFREENLVKCINYIEKIADKPTVQQLSAQFHMHRRTLLRLFKTHIGCSVKTYIDIVQFRKAINNYLNPIKDPKKLTELAHQYHFYDQSEFIRHLNKLTGSNPRHFFNSLTTLGSENTFWTIK